MDDDRSDVAFLKEMHKISRPEAVDRKQKLEKFMSNFDERRTPSKEMIEELKKLEGNCFFQNESGQWQSASP